MDTQTNNRSNQQRVRGYVVARLMEEMRARQIPPTEIQQMAKKSLELTEGIDDDEGLLEALQELSGKYPLLEVAYLKELAYVDDVNRAQVATQVSELLQQGKLEEAGSLAASHTHKE
ncbi:hypothetical protein KC614_00405 [candidate division WWE3 bacterium]|uniref:Uncharacterized protein n=1 Tax=candidate division WWE3 bacterium TaxID=2053526 RepID=A0A955LJH1_UNCKA|nr:hypothetical protein [candidate division WWE3 bacterium]